MATNKVYTYEEVAKHNTLEDCWVVIHGRVFDLSKFLKEHPGGTKPILNQAGKDGTKQYDASMHSTSWLDTLLPSSCCLGEIEKKHVESRPSDEVKSKRPSWRKPHINEMLNIFDFEAVAALALSPEGWSYYSSGADDEITLRDNHAAFHRIWLRPRVLVDVKKIDFSCTIMGQRSALPLYITSTALGKLAHPEGEVVLTRAAHNQGIPQMCPTLGSCSLDEMLNVKHPDQTLFFQLYVNQNRKLTEELVRKAERGGCKALCITVDAPGFGRREKDMRMKSISQNSHLQKDTQTNRSQGYARSLTSFIDPSLNWNDIAWFKTITTMPIVLKGVQCSEDALLAVHHGCAGIILSNHGGRQLDFARSGIEILEEVMTALRFHGYEDKIEVWIDGGIRRGSDIFKALAMGAKAVGIGRPTLYGLAAYGQEGAERVIELFKEELENTMRMMGTPTLADIKGSMVITKNLSEHYAMVPIDSLSTFTYQQVPLALSKL